MRKAIARFQSPAIAPSPSAPSQSPTLEQFSQEFTVNDPRKALEKMFNASPADHQLELGIPQKQPNFEIEDVLPELQPIVRYSLKKGWIKASDCKRDVRSLKGVSTEAIREYFLILAGQGVGTIRGEGKMLQYSALEG